MTLKIAILGMGNMGRNHLRILNMLKDVEILKIFDVNKELLVKLSNEYNVPWTTDVTDALIGVDAVIIVTPTSTHFEYFKLCADKVKNIFIEKPLAIDYIQAKQMKSLADQYGIFVQCGFIERFNPVVSELKQILKNEVVVNIDFTRTNRLSSRITDVDVVLDLMIHDIDLALYINGTIEKVVAFGKKEKDLVSFASTLFYHTNGAMSRILSSRMTEKKIRSIQVTTENLYIDAELLKKDITIHKQTQISQDEGKPYIISSLEQQIEVKHQEALLIELQAFIARCKGELVDIPDINSGVESLKISALVLEQIENV